MHSQGRLSDIVLIERIKKASYSRWDRLSDSQKNFAKRAWGVLTYKWRWQIAINIPYLLIFLLDRTVPAVHQFDMALLASITSKFPIPDFLASLIGLK